MFRLFLISAGLILKSSCLLAQDYIGSAPEKKIGLGFALEPGITMCFQEKLEGNQFIGKGSPFADPHFGLMFRGNYKKLILEAGLSLHSYSVAYSVTDSEVQSKSFSSSMTDHSGYRNYKLRICYEFNSRKKWFSLESYAGTVLLSVRKAGFFSGGGSNGSTFTPVDTIYYNSDWRAYNLGKNFLVPMIGVKSKFNFRKSSFYLSSEFIWSEKDWRSTEVRYSRSSIVAGSVTGQGVVRSKIKNLSFSLGYAYKIFHP